MLSAETEILFLSVKYARPFYDMYFCLKRGLSDYQRGPIRFIVGNQGVDFKKEILFVSWA